MKKIALLLSFVCGCFPTFAPQVTVNVNSGNEDIGAETDDPAANDPVDTNTGWADAGPEAADAGDLADDAGSTDAAAAMADAGVPAADDAGQAPADAGVTVSMDAGSAADLDAGTVPSDLDAGSPDAAPANCWDVDFWPEPPMLPPPFWSCPEQPAMVIATEYIGGAQCAELVGYIPYVMTWDDGEPLRVLNPGDVYMSIAFADLAPGVWDLSYRSRPCDGQDAGPTMWADYGLIPRLLYMTPEARAFIHCEWWDADAERYVAGDSCSIRIRVDDDGFGIFPAGNMANF